MTQRAREVVFRRCARCTFTLPCICDPTQGDRYNVLPRRGAPLTSRPALVWSELCSVLTCHNLVSSYGPREGVTANVLR